MAGAGRLRRLLVGLLVILASLGVLASTVALWARTQVLDTDEWTELTNRIIREPEVVERLSDRLSTAIIEGLDVEDRVSTALAGAERLPAQAALLAAPFTARIQDFLQQRIAGFLRSEEGRRLWDRVNRAVHQRVVAVLRDETRPGVTVEDGAVTLNTIPLINRGLARSEDLVSDIIGRPVTLPTAEEIAASGAPDRARQVLEERLGVDLPDDFGEVHVFNAERLPTAQVALRLLDRFVLAVVVVTVVLVVAALALSVARRRTLIHLAVGLLVGALVGRLAVRLIEGSIVDLAADRSRGAVTEVVGNVFAGLVDFTTTLLVLGIVIGLAAYLAGRPPWLGRVGDRLRTGGAGSWLRAHADGLRLAGLVTAFAALLLVNPSWLSITIVLMLLGVYELALFLLARPVHQSGRNGETVMRSSYDDQGRQRSARDRPEGGSGGSAS
jgi:hypothetical protein